MNSRIFISAVTRELGQTRQLAANVLIQLGYEPVWQEIFGTEQGDVAQMLRRKIDECDGLIHLVGHAYGTESSVSDPQIGPISYTQYELLHARQAGKPTWIFFAADGYSPDQQLSEPTELQERQAAWRNRLFAETDLWHSAKSATEFKLLFLQIKDELKITRASFQSWQRWVAIALAVGLVLGLGTWWGLGNLNRAVQEQPKQIADAVKNAVPTPSQIAVEVKRLTKEEADEIVDPPKMRLQLENHIRGQYQAELAVADQLADWRQREAATTRATETRDNRLRHVAETIASITETIQAGEASPEFLELTRILKDQGPAEALAYIAAKQSAILAKADQQSADLNKLIVEAQRARRRTLAPLLEAMRVQRTTGEYSAALARGMELLARDADWLDLLHELVMTESDWGDWSLRYETLVAALGHYEESLARSERAVSLDPEGRQSRRDLWLAYLNIGDAKLLAGSTGVAAEMQERALKLAERLADEDPRDAKKQRDLFISYNKLGGVFLTLGRTDDALTRFEDGLTISRKLADEDPRDAQKQRDLMVSHYKIGSTQKLASRYAAAVVAFQAGVDVLDKMIARNQFPQASGREKQVLEAELGFCQMAQIATGDWDELVKLPADQLPNTLSTRCTIYAARNEIEEVERATAKLAELQPPSSATQYNAACGHGLCAMILARKPEPLGPDDIVRRDRHLTDSLECLKHAVSLGYQNFPHLQANSDLASVRETPEFQEWFKTVKPVE